MISLCNSICDRKNKQKEKHYYLFGVTWPDEARIFCLCINLILLYYTKAFQLCKNRAKLWWWWWWRVLTMNDELVNDIPRYILFSYFIFNCMPRSWHSAGTIWKIKKWVFSLSFLYDSLPESVYRAHSNVVACAPSQSLIKIRYFFLGVWRAYRMCSHAHPQFINAHIIWATTPHLQRIATSDLFDDQNPTSSNIFHISH